MKTYFMPQAVALTDEKEIVLNDEKDISLSIIHKGEVVFVYCIPQTCDYGNGGLLLSPSKRLLVFSCSSGQSSEMFMLFKIEENSLDLLYDSGDIYGEDGDICFFANEEYMLQILRTGWWYAGEQGEEQIDKNGNKFYEFGLINVLSIKEKILDKHIIHVYPADEWKAGRTDNGFFEISEITDKTVSIIMPWGKEVFHYLLNDVVIIKP